MAEGEIGFAVDTGSIFIGAPGVAQSQSRTQFPYKNIKLITEFDAFGTSTPPLASPILTGTPTAPTPALTDNSTLIATTAFVKSQGYVTSVPVTTVAGRTGDVAITLSDIPGVAALSSPTFIGSPTAPTPDPNENSTVLATTAYVTRAAAALLPKAGGTMTGSLSVPALTIGGTPVSFGTAIGSILNPFEDFNNTGFPGLHTTNRLIFQRATAAATDSIDFQFQRVTSYTGGTSTNINQAMQVATTIGNNDGAQNWNFAAITTNNSTVGSRGPGAYFQGIRTAGSNGLSWGLISEVMDQSGLSSASSGPNLVGIEIDVDCNRADDRTNTAILGGVGVRRGIHMILSRYLTADTTQTEASSGIIFSTTSGGVSPDSHTNWGSTIQYSVNTQVRAGLDTRGAIPPNGSSNPVSAVTMAAGHVVDFKGGTALTSPPGRTLSYSSSKLSYQVSTVEVWSISDTGVVTASSLSGTGSYLSLTHNNLANGVSITGAPTGNSPVISVSGDINQSLTLQAAGSGAVAVKSIFNFGSNLANFLQGTGAVTGSPPTLITAGVDANRGLRISGKGTGGVVIGSGASLGQTSAGPFLLIPLISGVPSGTPTDAALGAAICYDTVNNKIWAYNGTAWKGVALS